MNSTSVPTPGGIGWANCSFAGTRFVSKATDLEPSLCDCYGGFYGDTCESVLPYFVPINWLLFVTIMVALGLLEIWAIIRFVHNFFERTKKKVPVFTLAMASQIMLSVAILLRMIHLSLQSQGRLLNYAEMAALRIQVLVLTIVNNAVTGLLLAATSLIIGFWFNIAISKLRLRAAKTIRMVSIVSTVVVCCIYTIGFVLIVVSREVTAIATSIIIAPLVFTVIGYFIIAIYLFAVTKDVTHITMPVGKERVSQQQIFVRKAVLALAFFWIFAIIFGAVGGSMANIIGTATLAYIPIWVYHWLEICIIVVVQIMLSRKRAPWTLIGEIISNGDFGGGIHLSAIPN